MSKKGIEENTARLGKRTNSSIVLIHAVEILKPSKKNIWRKICFIVVELLIAIVLIMNNNTITVFSEILEIMNAVLLAFFAVVFTGYALFQALIGDRLLLYLINETIEEDGEEKSHLENSNYYFAKVMLLQFILILLNLFAIIILSIVPDLLVMQIISPFLKEVEGITIIFILFHFNFEVLWETKSFIFNVFQLFNMHAMARIIDIMKNTKEEK